MPGDVQPAGGPGAPGPRRRRPLTDAHSYGQVSRFLSPAVRGLMDEVHSEGRLQSDDDVCAGTALVDGGLAGVDGALAGPVGVSGR